MVTYLVASASFCARIVPREKPETAGSPGFGYGVTDRMFVATYPDITSYIWVNYNDLTVLPNPGIMVNKGNHPQMALIQISEIL